MKTKLSFQFVLVMITRNAREAEALEILPQITQKVWEFEADNGI